MKHKVAVMMLGLLAFIACASAFPYKWYGIDPEAGKILGPVPAEDKPLSVCQGDDLQKGKCAVMLIDEFDRLRNDYIALKERLKKCEGATAQ